MSEAYQCRPAEAAGATVPVKAKGKPEAPRKGGPTVRLFERAQAGDEGCREEFRALLDHPERGPKVVELFGDLEARTGDAAVAMVARTNLAIKEATPRKLAKLREELEGPEPNVIERLLAGRVAYCWLLLHEYEMMLTLQEGKLTIRQSLYHQKRIDAAHRRYLSALRSLAAVRKLSIPALQVNVAESQVNIANRTSGTRTSGLQGVVVSSWL